LHESQELKATQRLQEQPPPLIWTWGDRARRFSAPGRFPPTPIVAHQLLPPLARWRGRWKKKVHQACFSSPPPRAHRQWGSPLQSCIPVGPVGGQLQIAAAFLSFQRPFEPLNFRCYLDVKQCKVTALSLMHYGPPALCRARRGRGPAARAGHPAPQLRRRTVRHDAPRCCLSARCSGPGAATSPRRHRSTCLTARCRRRAASQTRGLAAPAHATRVRRSAGRGRAPRKAVCGARAENVPPVAWHRPSAAQSGRPVGWGTGQGTGRGCRHRRAGRGEWASIHRQAAVSEWGWYITRSGPTTPRRTRTARCTRTHCRPQALPGLQCTVTWEADLGGCCVCLEEPGSGLTLGLSGSSQARCGGGGRWDRRSSTRLCQSAMAWLDWAGCDNRPRPEHTRVNVYPCALVLPPGTGMPGSAP
jgi:hypothetical protein